MRDRRQGRHLPRRLPRRHAPGGHPLRRSAGTPAAERRRLSRQLRPGRPARIAAPASGGRTLTIPELRRLAAAAGVVRARAQGLTPPRPCRSRLRRRPVRTRVAHGRRRPLARPGRLRDRVSRRRTPLRHRSPRDAGAPHPDPHPHPPGQDQPPRSGARRLLRPLDRVHRRPLRGPAGLRTQDRAERRLDHLPRRRRAAGAAPVTAGRDGRQGPAQPLRSDEEDVQSRRRRGFSAHRPRIRRRSPTGCAGVSAGTGRDAAKRRARAPTHRRPPPDHPHPRRSLGPPRRPHRRPRQETTTPRKVPSNPPLPSRRRTPQARRPTRQPRRPARRVVPRPLGRHPQGLRQLLHAARPHRAHRATHPPPAGLRPAPRRRGRTRPRCPTRELDPQASRGHPEPEGLRPGLRLRQFPAGRTPLSHQRALRLRPAPPPR